MGWIQLFTSLVGLTREVFKYMREHEQSNKACAAKVKEVSHALKSARKSKDTTQLESIIAGMGLAPAKPSDS